MNPLVHPYVRAFLYVLSAVVAAALAGFTALGEIPDWLIFLTAATSVLTGGTAVSYLEQNNAQ